MQLALQQEDTHIQKHMWGLVSVKEENKASEGTKGNRDAGFDSQGGLPDVMFQHRYEYDKGVSHVGVW